MAGGACSTGLFMSHCELGGTQWLCAHSSTPDPLRTWENQSPAEQFENFEVWMFRSLRNDNKASDNLFCAAFRISLSWRSKEKQRFWTIFLPATMHNPPSKMQTIFWLSSRRLSMFRRSPDSAAFGCCFSVYLVSQSHCLGLTKVFARMLLRGSPVLRHSLPTAGCQELLHTPSNADQPKSACV